MVVGAAHIERVGALEPEHDPKLIVRTHGVLPFLVPASDLRDGVDDPACGERSATRTWGSDGPASNRRVPDVPAVSDAGSVLRYRVCRTGQATRVGGRTQRNRNAEEERPSDARCR